MACKKFPLTEAGDAEHFAKEFGNRIRFDHRRGRWLVFGQHRWVSDTDGGVHRLGLESMRLRQGQALEVHDSDERRGRFKWAMAGESRRRIDNMLSLAKNLPPISDKGEDWDS